MHSRLAQAPQTQFSSCFSRLSHIWACLEPIAEQGPKAKEQLAGRGVGASSRWCSQWEAERMAQPTGHPQPVHVGTLHPYLSRCFIGSVLTADVRSRQGQKPSHSCPNTHSLYEAMYFQHIWLVQPNRNQTKAEYWPLRGRLSYTHCTDEVGTGTQYFRSCTSCNNHCMLHVCAQLMSINLE